MILSALTITLRPSRKNQIFCHVFPTLVVHIGFSTAIVSKFRISNIITLRR